MGQLVVLAAMLATVLGTAALTRAQGKNVTVMMEDNYFAPANITIEAGTTVTWVQNGNNPHTTTSYDELWDSGILPGNTTPQLILRLEHG